MHRNTLAFVAVAAVGGFVAGFWFANSLNRSAMTSLSNTSGTTQAGANTNTSQTQNSSDLSPDELRAKIAEADRNASDFTFQRDFGIALYRYAASKQDATLLKESIRILERGDALNSRDFELLVALGHGHFDLGFHNRDAARFQKAREIYIRALAIRPDDPDVKTDFGLTYYLQEPPAYDKAVAELTKVAQANPTHERSLQFLVKTYVKQGKLADADKTLAKIKSINPSNAAISELTTEIANARSGTGG